MSFTLLLYSLLFFISVANAFRQFQYRSVKSALCAHERLPTHFKTRVLQDVRKTFPLFVSSALIAVLRIHPDVAFADEVITREDVGFIDLNVTEPKITDVCWMDIQIEDSPAVRVEFSLFGQIAPETARNFRDLCGNTLNFGYRNSDIFRIIERFSVQGGSILPDEMEISPAARGLYGRAASGEPFPQENFRILHSYKEAGVLSMMKVYSFVIFKVLTKRHKAPLLISSVHNLMYRKRKKDIRNGNKQDSRFFITLEPYASWADDKYVAFGRVTSGMDFFRGLVILPVEPPSNYPKSRVRIINSGIY